jgi:hypothetical protein
LTSSSPQAAAATSPATTFHRAATLTGPVATGDVIEPISAHTPNLATNGYVEQEFFAAGTATAFKADARPSIAECDHAEDVGTVQNQDPGATTDGPGPLQRDGGGRVAERHER